MIAFGIVTFAAGALLLGRRLPLLTLPSVKRPQAIDRAEFLDIVIEESRAGRTPYAAVCAALVTFDRPIPEGPDTVADAIAPYVPQYAALWRLIHSRGAGLLEAAVAMREIETQNQRLSEELEVKVAGTRATMRMLIWLPWAFLAAGQLAGLHSLTALVTHVWGYPLMVLAMVLTRIGYQWTDRILRAALAC